MEKEIKVGFVAVKCKNCGTTFNGYRGRCPECGWVEINILNIKKWRSKKIK